MTDNPQPDRSLRAVLTVTVETRPDGGHYFDQADFTAHATEWVRAALKGQHAVDEVTIVDQAAELRRAQAGAHQYRTALQGVARSAAVPSAPADRTALSARLWAAAEQHIVAEWICCEPVNPKHQLCAKGQAALSMVRSLLVDADPEQAWNPAAPLLDAVLAELRRMADEAQQPTPCSQPNPCEDGGDPCTTHEREQAHADGDHGLCGPDCTADRCTCDSEDHTHDGGCPAAVSQPGKEA
ncbi:hypothetical protein [Streptomyces mirabilis]|uniref:hypothetical protein n=1 Tax=Streptomyces mirabilis TaxID=68239 RepID=UPI00364B5B30